MDKFSELKAAALAATPGPWRALSFDERLGISGDDSAILVCEHITKQRPHDALFIAAANPTTVLALLAELGATESRLHEVATACATAEECITELTRLLAHNIERAELAEKRLATPVRLVDYRNSPDMHTKQYYEAIGFNQGIDACTVAVRAAGFTVEGDEQ